VDAEQEEESEGYDRLEGDLTSQHGITFPGLRPGYGLSVRL